MKLHTLSLASLALLAASCNVQEPTSSTEPTSVVLAPRFAAGQALPHADSVSIRLLTEDSLVDTTQIVGNHGGQKIILGTLPPGVRFTITMAGFEAPAAGSRVTTWWISVFDSSGSTASHEIWIPAPHQGTAPLAAFDAVARTSYTIAPNGDTVIFQGKPIRLPAGTWITTNGGDPRSDTTARLADTLYLTDSVASIKAAVKTDANPATGTPTIWSPVKTFTLAVDSLDTLTALDTLMMTSWRAWSDSFDTKVDTNDREHSDSLNTSGVRQAPFFPNESVRTDTLTTFFGNDGPSASMHCYVVPSSPRATIRVGTQSIPSDSFVKIPFPSDSSVEVIVENHGRSRMYTVNFVWGLKSFINKHLDSLKTPSPGLKKDPTDNTKFMIELPAGQDTLKLQPFVSAECSTRIGSQIIASGETASVHVGMDTATIQLHIFSDRTDKVTLNITVRVSHTLPITFRDTTNGVPWRDVPYDTLVYNSRKYRTVAVGNARWMAENLAFRVDSSFCAGQSVEACSKFGRLYTWSGAADTTAHYDSAGLTFTGNLQGVCPVGWHLPSSTEWQSLIDLLGSSRAATLLQSYGTSWVPAGGQDTLGLRILPAGHRTITVSAPYYYFAGQNSEAWFWTSTQGPSQNQASAFRISSNTGVADIVPGNPKAEALSVRCVSDTAVVAP